MWILIVCLSYVFAFSEIALVLTKRSRKATVKTKKDRGSLVVLYIIFSVVLTAGFYLANFRYEGFLSWFLASSGILIYVFGLIIRWASIIQLKKAFTVDVAINHYHELKTDGLYNIVRHPSYFGLILIFAGLSVSMNSLYSFLIITVPVFLGISYRISIEEKLLISEFGEGYLNYKSTTKKIIPGIY